MAWEGPGPGSGVSTCGAMCSNGPVGPLSSEVPFLAVLEETKCRAMAPIIDRTSHFFGLGGADTRAGYTSNTAPPNHRRALPDLPLPRCLWGLVGASGPPVVAPIGAKQARFR